MKNDKVKRNSVNRIHSTVLFSVQNEHLRLVKMFDNYEYVIIIIYMVVNLKI